MYRGEILLYGRFVFSCFFGMVRTHTGYRCATGVREGVEGKGRGEHGLMGREVLERECVARRSCLEAAEEKVVLMCCVEAAEEEAVLMCCVEAAEEEAVLMCSRLLVHANTRANSPTHSLILSLNYLPTDHLFSRTHSPTRPRTPSSRWPCCSRCNVSKCRTSGQAPSTASLTA